MDTYVNKMIKLEDNTIKDKDNLNSVLNGTLDNMASLEEYANVISAEGNIMASIQEFIAVKFNSVTNSIDDIVNTIVNKLGDDSEYNSLVVRIKTITAIAERIAVNSSFIEIEDRVTPVVVGLNVNMETLINLLEENNKIINDNFLDKLKGVESLLGKILSVESFRTSFRPNKHKDLDISKDIKAIKKNFDLIINVRSNTDRIPVKRLVSNISSIKELVKRTKEINVSSPDAILKEAMNLISNIKEETNLLESSIKNDGVEFKITKETLVFLAKTMDEYAKMTTLVAHNVFLRRQQVFMLENLVEVINK